MFITSAALPLAHTVTDAHPLIDHGCMGETNPVNTNDTPYGSQRMNATTSASDNSGSISVTTGTIPTVAAGEAYICFLSTDYDDTHAPLRDATDSGVDGATYGTKAALFTVL